MKRIVALFLVILLLTGCAAKEKSVQEYVFCMDTVMTLSVWGADAENVIPKMTAMLYEMERTWSANDENSLVSALNMGAGTPDGAQQALLDMVLGLKIRTNGAFDPQLRGLIVAWGFPTDEYRMPSQTELATAMELDHWDLGAAVKGFAGQQLVELLEQYEIDRAMLNLGGNIQTYGSKADGNPWLVAVQNPDLSEDHLGILAVTGTMSVVTSGDYQRYFELDGTRYHHILDPKTGYPAESGLASVTVICRDGLTADALSTALFVMGLEIAADFWRNSNDFEAVFVTKDGKIYATEGANLSGCVFEVIQR